MFKTQERANEWAREYYRKNREKIRAFQKSDYDWYKSQGYCYRRTPEGRRWVLIGKTKEN